jgi:hypothetical protein
MLTLEAAATGGTTLTLVTESTPGEQLARIIEAEYPAMATEIRESNAVTRRAMIAGLDQG